jgi:hypothetical protein
MFGGARHGILNARLLLSLRGLHAMTWSNHVFSLVYEGGFTGQPVRVSLVE